MRMDAEACEECIEKCKLIHGGRDSLPLVTSFFKIMIGAQFLDRMLIPRPFAKTIVPLDETWTCLEDTKGQRWRVKISTVDTYLAFEQGWPKFASEHSIESGDFVVFHYFVGSHFVTQIYNQSGSEKLNFSKKSNTDVMNKPMTKISSTSRNAPPNIAQNGLGNERKSFSRCDHDIEMMNIGGGRTLYKRKQVDSNVGKNRGQYPSKSTPLAGSNNNVREIIKEVPSCSKGKELKSMKKSHEEKIEVKHVGKRLKSIEEDHKDKVKAKQGNKPVVVKVEPDRPVVVKVELEDHTFPDMEIDESIPVDLPNVHFFPSVSALNPSFLEIPTELPYVRRRGHWKRERRIVFLRDPSMNIWPVFYYERPRFKVLAGGWEYFAKANGIQLGDMCFLEVEDAMEGLFRVRISRKPL
ncbi:hypothetical protein GIB67_004499 [Kingdonia uniflora]|uniref:TF-B3 domain-containing protein n=1 Tax=Kingdonia uniflora TaxID=39325 RepID=A0A7J7MRM0_9MAGN|nr:hypothetical protein GIB67_004499 [Kingdonia uniflora]